MLQVWLRYKGLRIICREHGVHREPVPWAVHGSRFTKDFEQQVTWLGLNMSKKAMATFMKIDWATVGRCISRCRERIEPHPEERLHGLVNIAVDETSYRTGHKYITVIINQDTCSVVWAHEGHGKEVLMKFFDALTPEQLKAIKTVSGDGARWIDACIKERIPHATRCVDSFHVVTWAMEVVDKLRLNFAAERRAQAKSWEQKGCSEISEQIRQEGQKIKATKYVAGQRPEHLTEKQKERRMWLETWCPDLYIAINYRDCLSKLVGRSEADKIQENLNIWQNLARKSRIPEIRALGEN